MTQMRRKRSVAGRTLGGVGAPEHRFQQQAIDYCGTQWLDGTQPKRRFPGKATKILL
jgi:hypothetical protein